MAAKSFKSITELFAQSYAAVARNLSLFLFLNILSIFSVAWRLGTDLKDKTNGSSWGQIFSNGVLGKSSDYPTGGAAGLIVVFVLLTVVLGLMSVILEVRAAQGKQMIMAEIWQEFKSKWLRLLLVEILTFVFIGLGFLAFIIPGLIILPRLILAPYLLVDQDTEAMEALRKSWHLTKGYSAEIYYVILFSILLGLTSLFPIIGSLISFALALAFSVAMPIRYFELKSKQ